MPFDRLAAAKMHLGGANILRVDARRYREFKAAVFPCSPAINREIYTKWGVRPLLRTCNPLPYLTFYWQFPVP